MGGGVQTASPVVAVVQGVTQVEQGRDALPQFTTAPALIKRIQRGTASLLTGGPSSQSTLSDQTSIKGLIQQPWHSASNISLSCLSEKRPKRYAKKGGYNF